MADDRNRRQPLHLGMTPWQVPVPGSASQWCEQAQWAEAAGFSSFWLPESHFTGADALPVPLLQLAAMAAATDRITLATTSLLLPVRNALQTAAEVAVLDQLCAGRLILGLGRGFQPELFRAHGIAPKHKRDLFAQVLAQMLAAWAGDPLASDAAGNPVTLQPRPLQQPHPPLWVAAFGPKALAQVGRLGLPWLASPMEPLADLASNLAVWRAAVVAAGKTPPAEVPVMRMVFVSSNSKDLARVRAGLAQAMDQRSPGAADDIDQRVLLGTPVQVAEQLADYRATLGMTHLVATRLRLPGLPAALSRHSLQLLRELVPTGAN